MTNNKSKLNKKEILTKPKPKLIRGNTPLQVACRAGDLEEVKKICKEGQPFLDFKNIMGNTALDIAQKKGYTEVADYLLNLSTSK